MKDALMWMCNFFTLVFTATALTLGLVAIMLAVICGVIAGKDIDGWLVLAAFIGLFFFMQTVLRIRQNKDFIVLPFPRIGL